MNKKQPAIIWRKSVYDTRCCPRCGTRLIDKKNQPINIIQREIGRVYFFCERCDLPVAYLAVYDGSLKPGEMGGRWKGE